MQNDNTRRVNNFKSFIETCFWVTNLTPGNKRFLFELLTQSWKEKVPLWVITPSLTIKNFMPSYQFQNRKKKSWFQIIVARDVFVEMKYYPVQNIWKEWRHVMF